MTHIFRGEDNSGPFNIVFQCFSDLGFWASNYSDLTRPGAPNPENQSIWPGF